MTNPNNLHHVAKTAIAESRKLPTSQSPLVRLKADIALHVGLAKAGLGISAEGGKAKLTFQADANGLLADLAVATINESGSRMRKQRTVLSDGWQGKKAQASTRSIERGQRWMRSR